MATTLLYLYQPVVRDLPAGVDAGSLAWFGRWSSGHLSHADARLVRHGQDNGLNVEQQEMWWFEYQRLLAEAYWFEQKQVAVMTKAAASNVSDSAAPGGHMVEAEQE